MPKEEKKEQTILSRFFGNLPFLGYLSPQAFKGFIVILDILAIIVAFFSANVLRHFYRPDLSPDIINTAYLIFLPPFIIIWVSLLYFMGMYTSFNAQKKIKILFIIFKAAIWGFLIWTAYMYILNIHYVTAKFMIITCFLTASFVSSERLGLIFLFRYQSKMGIDFRRILIVGLSRRVKDFIVLNNRNVGWPIKIVGLVDKKENVGTMLEDYEVIGSFSDLPELIDKYAVDEVVFILPRKLLIEIEDYILLCEKMGVRILIAADLFSPSIARLKSAEINDLPFLIIDTIPYNASLLFLKRLFDFFVALIALIISLPVCLIISIATKLTSPGPVLFKQKRVGLRGRIFTLYKFRSMIVGAEDMLSEIKDLSESKGPVFHSRNDPRVTPIGKFLRMTSLDEIPQLFNVIKGDMSLIGPRPPLSKEVKEYKIWQKRRLSLRPGIVCTWQVTKRFQPNFNEWVKMDLDYIDNWSLSLDFKILLKIPLAILKGIHYWLSGKQ